MCSYVFSHIFATFAIVQSMETNQRLSGHYASIYPSQHDANLVLVRQQRDLFSGGPSPTHLGIPDVTTHVGSVIHAFETLAQQRQLKESENVYESSASSVRKESMHKISLPPPPPVQKTSTGTLTTEPMKHIVRHRPKGRAPNAPASSSTNTASATTQTTKFSGDENESSALDSLNLEDDIRRSAKFPQSYIKNNYKVLPPFVPPRQPSRIPTKAINSKTSSSARNRMSDSLLLSKTATAAATNPRTDVFLKPTKYTEDDVENDFLRGTTVSQSFIKNVVRKSPTPRKISTYEHNFLMNMNDDDTPSKKRNVNKAVRNVKSRSMGERIEQPLIDEVSKRYKEYSGNNSTNNINSISNYNTNNESMRQFNFQPRSIDRAEL